LPPLQEYGFDAFQEQEELDEFLFRLHSAAYARQRRPGILFVETFRTCSVHASDCDDHYPGPKQGQLSYNFSGDKVTTVLLSNAHLWGIPFARQESVQSLQSVCVYVVR
jgi:hypothetical protein